MTDFDDVREDVIYNLDEDQHAGFMHIYLDDEGRCQLKQAIDANRLPPDVSREQAVGVMVMKAMLQIGNPSIAELIQETFDLDVTEEPGVETVD